MDLYEEAERVLAFLDSAIKNEIARNLEEDANRGKPDLDRLKALGMID